MIQEIKINNKSIFTEKLYAFYGKDALKETFVYSTMEQYDKLQTNTFIPGLDPIYFLEFFEPRWDILDQKDYIPVKVITRFGIGYIGICASKTYLKAL